MKSWGAIVEKLAARDWPEILSVWTQDAIGLAAADVHRDDLFDEMDGQIAAAKGAGQTSEVMAYRRHATFSDLAAIRLKATAAHFEAMQQVYNGSASLAVSLAHDAFLYHCRFVAAALGLFIGLHGGNYCALDVFPWMGPTTHEKAFRKKNAHWRSSLQWYVGLGKPPSQEDMFEAFQRLLRVTSNLPISQARRDALTGMDKRRTSSLRNNTIYSNRGWFFYEDLLAPCLPLTLWSDLQFDAAKFKGAKADIHPLGAATIVGDLATSLWEQLAASSDELASIRMERVIVPPIEARILTAQILPE